MKVISFKTLRLKEDVNSSPKWVIREGVQLDVRVGYEGGAGRCTVRLKGCNVLVCSEVE